VHRNTVARSLAIAIAMLSMATLPSSADSIRYAWTGVVKPAPGAPENPWELAPDGTPFLFEAFVDAAAVDQDGTQNPDFARFLATEATLVVGDRKAALTMPNMRFSDDAFTGLFDSASFDAQAELSATMLSFSTGVRIDTTSFALADPAAPDLPPLFPESLPVQLGGTGTGGGLLTTFPDAAPVTATPVPWTRFPAATAVEWTDATSGVAADVEVTLAGASEPLLHFFDLSGPAYDAAPAFSLTSGLEFDTGSTWTATFSEPVATVLVYTVFWRGTAAGVDPATYHFDVPFSIRSGLEEASLVGNSGGLLLSLPGGGFHDGIVQVPGPLTSLTVTPNSTTSSNHAMAVAVVPMPTARPVAWSTPASGTAGSVAVTLSELGASASLQSADLSGSDFAVAPRSASAPVVEYDTGADWTVAFSEPVEGLLLYAKGWRGHEVGIDPVTYRFDAPFTILSGLREAKVSEDGQLLTLPAEDFHDGIVYVPGPLTSLTVEGDDPGDGAQALTLAVVPEPGAGATGLAACAALIALRLKSRRTGPACGAAALRSSASGSARSARTPS
jgi:hypothetical protein